MHSNDPKHDDLDPRPLPPGPGECCGSGCAPCILEVYEDELARWREREARRQAARQREPTPTE